MADVSRTIEIIFAGTDSVSSVMQDIGGNIESAGDKMQDFGAPFLDAAEKVILLNTAIAGIAAAGIAASSEIESQSVKMKNSLGLPIEEAERFREIALEVYSGGYGDDLASSFEAVTLAQKKFGDNAEIDIGKVTGQAFALQKTFGTDINESLGAVSTLMKNFGITSEDALNLLTTGYQKGLDGSGDLIESINEYSTQFANGGADAGQFFSVLESGFSEGMLGTDRAADLFKEFRVRIQDDSETTKEALESIGIDPASFAANMASGEMTAIEAFNIIQGKLNETEDKTVQFNAGVGLMGTQFEDLGQVAALAINTTTTAIEDMDGAINSIDTQTFKESMLASFRTISTEFGTMTQWDEARGKIAATFGDIAASFGPAMEGVDFSGLEDGVAEIWGKIQNIFVENDLDLTTVEGMQNAIQLVIDGIEGLFDVTSGMIDIFSPIFTKLVDLADGFNDLSPDVKEMAGEIIGLGSALVGLGVIVSAGGSLIGGFGSLMGLLSSGGALATGITAIATLLTGPVGLAVGLGVVGTTVAAYTMGSIEAENQKAIESIKEQTAKIKELTEQISELPAGVSTVEIFATIESGDLETASELINDLTAEQKLIDIKTVADQQELDDMLTRLAEIPDEKQTEILALMNAGDFEAVEKAFFDIANPKTTDISVITNSESIEEVKKEFEQVGTRADGSPIMAEITAKGKDIEKVKADIETIPAEKLLEIKLQGEIDTEIAQIQASADLARDAFKYTAEVKVAEAEAAAQVLEQAFESAGESVDALSESTSGMFGTLLDGWGDLDMIDQNKFLDMTEKQQETQNKALESQIKLNEAQIEYMNAKAEALASGDGQIKIDSTGLEPALEMVMWEIIEKVQIKASEESASFLLGV